MPQLQDPKELEAKPPFPDQPQTPPGNEEAMNPKPDHGENSYVGSDKLTGRKALITGGDSGIGRAIALAFAREGADVVISYLNEDNDAQETVRLVEGAGRKGLAMPGDIRTSTHCQELINQTVKELGGLDILVNNAAYQMSYEDIDQITDEELDKTFKTNIYAPFYLSRAAAKVMKPGSSIINTTSIQAYDPSGMLLAYATTKGAIANFTRALSELMLKKGIRVNAVAPGPVWTPLIPSTMPADYVKKFGSQAPMGRPAQPAELAPAYVFLASDQASYVTGAIYEVTGGMFTA